MHRWSRRPAIIMVAFGALAAGATNAQSAFKEQLKILVGFAAGGSSETAARMLAAELKDSLSQPVLVENRLGAGGGIAAEALKNAPPNNATLLLTPVVVPVLAPLVLKELKYVPAKDFAPLSQVATYQFAFDLDTDPDEYCDLGRDCGFGGVRSDIRERLLAWFMRLKCP
jgi:tripartite-type tricarboxylate transporter receptor subunit TctC